MSEKNIPSAFLIPSVSALKGEVERVYAGKIITSRDFESLADSIFSNTGQTISPTTLKRMWGYINEPKEPRRFTLDLLARYCGWPDFERFVEGRSQEIESGPIGTQSLNVSSDLKSGARVRLFWNPGRMCLIRYLGQDRWEVEESRLTRLNKGDRFNCALIAEGEPLYLDNLVKDGRKMPVYVCGRDHGITFKLEEDE